MQKRIVVLVDIGNLFYCCGRKWVGRKVDYARYLAEASKLGDVLRAVAYGTQRDDEAAGFIACLRHTGFEVKYRQQGERRIAWDVGIALDAVRMMGRVDAVVLGSASPDMVPLAEFLRDSGVECIVLACGINRDLKHAATTFIELTEDVLVSDTHEAVE